VHWLVGVSSWEQPAVSVRVSHGGLTPPCVNQPPQHCVKRTRDGKGFVSEAKLDLSLGIDDEV
jgi:hypothetical protein